MSNKIANSKMMFEDVEISIDDPFRDIKDYSKPTLIIFLLDSGKITTSKARDLLLELRHLYGNRNVNFDTNFKCAVTMLSKLKNELEVGSRPV